MPDSLDIGDRRQTGASSARASSPSKLMVSTVEQGWRQCVHPLTPVFRFGITLCKCWDLHPEHEVILGRLRLEHAASGESARRGFVVETTAHFGFPLLL